jgi:hypothetical protein
MGKKKPVTKPLLGSTGGRNASINAPEDVPKYNSTEDDDALAEINRLVGNDYLGSEDDDEIAISALDGAGRIDMSIHRYTDSPMTTPVGTPLDSTTYVPQTDSPTSQPSSRLTEGVPSGASEEDLEEGLSLDDIQTKHPPAGEHRRPGWSDDIDLISKDYYGLVHNYIAVAFLYATSVRVL